MSRINPVTGQREYEPGDTSAPVYFDYDHQVWVKDGVYQDCGHPTSMDCGCFGRAHAGQPVGHGCRPAMGPFDRS